MLRVLVVDDDPDVLLLVESVLARSGHSVVVSHDASRLSELIREEEPSVVVLDVDMPDRSGFDLVAELRSSPPTRDLPVLLLSTHSQARSRVRGLKLGADDYLTKPFDPEELVLRIERLAEPRTVPESSRLTLADLERHLGNGPFPPGLQVDRYELGRLLGVGSAGHVFSGWDPRLERPVAIKTVRLSPGGSLPSREAISALLREARTLARFNHPNIVAVFDAGDGGGGLPFVAMELVNGASLGDLLELHKTLPAESLVPIVLAAARGLEAAHASGLIHGDVNPRNILLARDGDVKVSDFGFSRLLQDLEPGQIFGTPGYIAPEILQGERPTVAADLFSLGVVLFDGLTGELPCGTGSLSDLLRRTLLVPAPALSSRLPACDPQLESLIGAMLAREPGDRPSGMTEACERLEQLANRMRAFWEPESGTFRLEELELPIDPRRPRSTRFSSKPSGETSP